MSSVNGRPPSAGTITGALQHTGTTVGLFGVTPATRTTGVAQLTDNSGGTTDDTLAAVSNSLTGGVGLSSPTATSVNTELGTIRNNLADLAAKQNTVMTALKSLGIIGV